MNLPLQSAPLSLLVVYLRLSLISKPVFLSYVKRTGIASERLMLIATLSNGQIGLQYNAFVLYYIVYIYTLNSASCSANQSEALPVRETQREESSVERTKRGLLIAFFFLLCILLYHHL